MSQHPNVFITNSFEDKNQLTHHEKTVKPYQCISWYQKICLFLLFLSLYHEEMCLYKQGAEMRLVSMFFRVYVVLVEILQLRCAAGEKPKFFQRRKTKNLFFSLQALPCASASCSVPLSVCEESAGKIHTWAQLHFTDYIFEVEKSRNTILLLWLSLNRQTKIIFL